MTDLATTRFGGLLVRVATMAAIAAIAAGCAATQVGDEDSAVAQPIIEHASPTSSERRNFAAEWQLQITLGRHPALVLGASPPWLN